MYWGGLWRGRSRHKAKDGEASREREHDAIANKFLSVTSSQASQPSKWN